MKQINLIIFVTLGIFAPLLVRSAQGTPQGDFYIRQAIERYFDVPQDAISLSLGSSSALQCESANCIYQNPAGLGFLADVNIALAGGTNRSEGDDFINGERIEQLDSNGYLALSTPLGHVENVPEFGTLAVAYSRYKGDTDDTINTRPDGHRRSVGYGIVPFDNVGLGYSFTFYDDQLHSDLADLHSHARFLHLFGAQVKTEEGFTFGAHFKLGIGQSDTEDFQFESNGLSHLKQYTGALSIRKSWYNLRTFLGADYSNYTSRGNLSQVSTPVLIGSDEEGYLLNFRFGVESEVVTNLSLRAGFRYEVGNYEFDRPDLARLSGRVSAPAWASGIGYAFFLGIEGKSPSHLDYGFEYLNSSRGDWQHLLSLTVPVAF